MNIKSFDENTENIEDELKKYKEQRNKREEERLRDITNENWQGKLILAVEDLVSAVEDCSIGNGNGSDYTHVLSNIDDAIRTGKTEYIDDELRNICEKIGGLNFTIDFNYSKIVDRVDFVLENVYEEKIEKQYQKDKEGIDAAISWIKNEIENIDIDNTGLSNNKDKRVKSIKVLAKDVEVAIGIDNTFMTYLLIKRLLIKEGIVVKEGSTSKLEKVFIIEKYYDRPIEASEK